MTGAVRIAAHYLRFTYSKIGNHLFGIWGLGIVGAAFESLGILLFVPILIRLVSPEDFETPGQLGSGMIAWADRFSIEALLGMLVVLFGLKGLVMFLIGVYRARTFARTRERMRLEVFEALGRVRIRHVQTQRLGSLGNLLVHEIDGAGFAMDRACAALGSLTTGAMLFAVAISLHPPLGGALILSGMVSLALIRVFARARMLLSRSSTGRASEMSSIAIESIQSFKYLRATGRFPVLRNAFAAAAREARKLDDRAAVVDHSQHAVREPLLVLWIAGVFYFFVVLMRQHLSVITDGILFFYRVSIEISLFQDQWHEFSSRVGSVDAYQNLLNDLRSAEEAENEGQPPRFEDEIRFEKVGLSHGSTAILRELDLRIRKNQTVALVGASGAGKSTVVDLLAGCLEPSAGRILVDDVDLAQLDRARYRAGLGYVTQESIVFSGSVARNITMQWNDEIREDEIARAREAARLANCLDLIEGLEQGWQTEVGERGLRLSGGERQRVAIARELYAEPELLILDEATSALDSVAERAVQTSLELLHGRLTILIVAHRLSTIRHADLVCVLDEGAVVEAGSFSELSSREGGRFRKLCEMQSLV